jgi:hypothetical protein
MVSDNDKEESAEGTLGLWILLGMQKKERTIQVNLLWEHLQDLIREPTSALSQQ